MVASYTLGKAGGERGERSHSNTLGEGQEVKGGSAHTQTSTREGQEVMRGGGGSVRRGRAGSSEWCLVCPSHLVLPCPVPQGRRV